MASTHSLDYLSSRYRHFVYFFFFSISRRHTRFSRDWSSDVCSSDLRHFVDDFEWVTGAKITIEEYGWDRITVDGADHGHAFSRAGGGTRTTVVTIDGPSAWVVSGLTDLVVLKSTGSEFWGFPRDRYTSLAETNDRTLATAVTARWRY